MRIEECHLFENSMFLTSHGGERRRKKTSEATLVVNYRFAVVVPTATYSILASGVTDGGRRGRSPFWRAKCKIRTPLGLYFVSSIFWFSVGIFCSIFRSFRVLV